jgi:hypothetical protein
MISSFESHDGGKKGIAEKGRRQNQLSYNRVERKKQFQRCLKGGHPNNCVCIIVY